MALTPGGGRSPSTQSPPPPTQTSPVRPSRPRGRPRWTRSATISVLRYGVLMGGLVIIVDLSTLAMQRGLTGEDLLALAYIDRILNYALFAALGVLVARDTSVMFAGFVAGLIAGLLDALVVTLATVMVPLDLTSDAISQQFIENLVTGAVVAGVSGVVYVLVQRWLAGQRGR